MKAIMTKFHGPTNTRGSRISASDSDGNRVFLACNDALRPDDMHEKAAYALCTKMGWQGKLVGGSTGSSGNVFVFADEAVDPLVKTLLDLARQIENEAELGAISNTLYRIAQTARQAISKATQSPEKVRR